MKPNLLLRKAFLCLLILLLSSCGRKQYGPVERSWGRMEKNLRGLVGNMDDVSYSGTRDKARPNALGKPVSMGKYAGKFVWSEYAATWCGTCAKQTPQTKKADRQMKGAVVFLTVMTAKGTEYDNHATVDTAKQWSRRFGLPSEKVIAAELWYKTIPEHRFYSPEGHTLFVHVGFLSATQITDVIAYYRSGWVDWVKRGVKPPWMQ